MKFSATDNRTVISAMAIATVIVLFPILSVAVPPILDYPNHYARLWLLSGGARDPSLSGIYRIDWSLTWVNTFIDAVAALLGPLFGVQIVSVIVLSLGLLLPPFGLALLSRSLFGTFSSWNVLCFMLCWNWIFFAGFINFEVGLGLALLSAALEPVISPRLKSMAFVARFVFAFVIILVHPFGGMFYFTLLIGLALGERFEEFLSRRTVAFALARAANRGWPVVLALALIVAFGPKTPGANAEPTVIWNEWALSTLLGTLTTYFRSYNALYDALVAALFVSVICGAAVCRRLRYHAGLLAVALGLGLISPFVPREMMATAEISRRLPSMMVLAMAACLRPELEMTATAGRWAVGAALTLVFLRTAYITKVWQTAEGALAAVRSAVASVQPGSAVLPVQFLPTNLSAAPLGRMFGGLPNYWHYPSLVVVDRKAFIPWLFSAPGKQPLRVLPPWKEIAVYEGQPPPVGALLTTNGGKLAYVNNWRTRFDYILLLNGDMDSNGPPIEQVPGLGLVSDQGFARLYRVTSSSVSDKVSHP